MLNTSLREPGSKDQESYWSLKGLPPFPAVVTRLLGLLSTDDYSMQQLVDLGAGGPDVRVRAVAYRQFGEVRPGEGSHQHPARGRDSGAGDDAVLCRRRFPAHVHRSRRRQRSARESLAALAGHGRDLRSAGRMQPRNPRESRATTRLTSPGCCTTSAAWA